MSKQFGANGFTDAFDRPDLAGAPIANQANSMRSSRMRTLHTLFCGSRYLHRLANRGGRAGARRAS